MMEMAGHFWSEKVHLLAVLWDFFNSVVVVVAPGDSGEVFEASPVGRRILSPVIRYRQKFIPANKVIEIEIE